MASDIEEPHVFSVCRSAMEEKSQICQCHQYPPSECINNSFKYILALRNQRSCNAQQLAKKPCKEANLKLTTFQASTSRIVGCRSEILL